MLIDKAGTLFRRRRQRPSRIDNILLVFFGSFGDGLLFTSILKSLREQLPQARIDVLASKDVGVVLEGCPYLSNIYVTNMPSGKEYPSKVRGLVTTLRDIGVVYDAALCLRGPIDNGVLPLFLSGISRYNVGFATGGFSFCLDEVVPWRAGIHETEHFLDVVRALLPQCQLGPQELFHDTRVVGASLEQKLALLGLAGTNQFVVVHPGSKVMRRSLSVERWRTVLTDLVEKTSNTILVTGVDSERGFFDSIGVSHPRIIPTLGMLSIPELAELIKRSCGVVTVETFVSHLAGFANIPAIAFWTGVTDVRQWRPVGRSVIVASVNPPCSPCFKWCDRPVCMDHRVETVVEILQAK
jgi:heptosyltransferase-2/heptosyltransferase-3